jgi:hypothetical protein
LLADIVNAGWLPRAYFEAAGGPGSRRGILAFSVSFIFIDLATGLPTDLNGDHYLDTALNGSACSRTGARGSPPLRRLQVIALDEPAATARRRDRPRSFPRRRS